MQVGKIRFQYVQASNQKWKCIKRNIRQFSLLKIIKMGAGFKEWWLMELKKEQENSFTKMVPFSKETLKMIKFMVGVFYIMG